MADDHRHYRPPDEPIEDDPGRRALFDDDAPYDEPFDTGVVRVIPPGQAEPVLRFGPDNTGPLPHWTDPPTGEVPSVLGSSRDDDLDAWSGLGAQPVWRDDRTGGYGDDDVDFAALDDGTRAGALTEHAPGSDPFFDDDLDVGPARDQEPTQVTAIRTRRASATATKAARRGGDAGGSPGRAPRPSGSGTGGRNMPLAVGVGLGIAALALVLLLIGPAFFMAFVVVALVAAAAELIDTLRRAGYHPASLVALVAVAGMPLATYWRGQDGLLLVLALAVVTTLVWFMATGTIESNPVPNGSVTLFTVLYVGVLGSFAALILQFENGTGTILVLALGTVAYDVGGLFFGSSAGRTPLLPWISPNKTIEGLVGGMVMAVLAVLACKLFGVDPWGDDWIQALQLGVVVAAFAPLGDLAESMLKRNLGVKDMSVALPGHGGVLDRFDAFLFVLPAAYYLSRLLNVY